MSFFRQFSQHVVCITGLAISGIFVVSTVSAAETSHKSESAAAEAKHVVKTHAQPHGTPVKQGNAARGQQLSTQCTACHGSQGASTIADNPKLAGQNLQYINKQLHNFSKQSDAEPLRKNAVMASQVVNLSEQDMLDLATYFSNQAPVYATSNDEESLIIAERLYRAGDKKRGITACSACHGPAGSGNAGAKYPRVAGQHAKYVTTQLQAFRTAARGDYKGTKRTNDPEAMMRDTAKNLTDFEIEALANYIQGLRK